MVVLIIFFHGLVRYLNFWLIWFWVSFNRSRWTEEAVCPEPIALPSTATRSGWTEEADCPEPLALPSTATRSGWTGSLRLFPIVSVGPELVEGSLSKGCYALRMNGGIRLPWADCPEPVEGVLRAQDERRKPIALSLSKGPLTLIRVNLCKSVVNVPHPLTSSWPALDLAIKSLDLIRVNLRKSAVKSP